MARTNKAASKAAATRKRRAKLAEKPLATLRAEARGLVIEGRSGMNKAALAKAIDEAKTGKGRKPKPTQKARKAATAAKKRESQARHGRGPYRLVIAKNNAIYGNLGPYASARAALSDAKTLLRRIAPVKGYALSNVEAQKFVGETFAGGKVVDGYVVTSRGGPDLNAAAFAVKVGKGSKAAYADDKIPAALRNNGRGRKRRNTLPSWRGASAAYSKADKILEVWNRKEAAAQKRAHTKRGRAASTFRYRPTAEIKAFTDALNKGDEEKIKAFNLIYGHMLTKKRNPSKRRNAADKVAARELYLFTVNDGDLYRSQGTAIITNLAKKMAKGQFDRAKAVKLVGYLADNGARKYGREFVGPRRGAWQRYSLRKAPFTVADRRAAAHMILDDYMEQIRDEAASMGGSRRNPSKRRKNPRVSFKTKSGKRVSFMAKKKR